MMADVNIAVAGLTKIGAAVDWVQMNGVGAAIYVAIAVGIYLLLIALRSIVRKAVGKPDDFAPHSWREITARMLQRTRSFFLAAIAAELVTISVAAPPALLGLVRFLFTVAVVIQGAIWLREFILAIIARRAAAADPDHSTLASAMGVVRLIVTVVVLAVAAILILDNMGVNVTALVAGLGIGGIAIGLAAQGIFSDLFAALSILFDKPFKPGDTINVDDLTGTVEAIGLKTTRVRALSGEIVVISNSKLLESKIRNFAQYNRRRVVFGIGVTYQTPPDVLAALPGEIEAVVTAQPDTTFGRAHIYNFGASAIEFEIVFFVECPEHETMMLARHEIMIGIIRRMHEMRVEFAYPTQTTFTAAPDGTLVMPYAQAKAG